MTNQKRPRVLLVGGMIGLVLIVIVLLVLLIRSMSMPGNTLATATIANNGVPDTLVPTMVASSITPNATATQHAIVQQTQRVASTQTQIAQGNHFASQEAAQATTILTAQAMKTQYYQEKTATAQAGKK